MPGLVSFPLACFVGLAVSGTEVTVAGYVRQPCTLELAADGTTYANTVSQQWQHATADWGTIDEAQLWDAPTGGKLLGWVSAFTPLTVRQYDIARIPASGLTASYIKISRPFGTGNYGTFGFGTARAFRGNVYKQRPYGSGLYGSNLYGGYLIGAYLERAFDQQQHLCAPGTWAPGPFSLAA
jgi:hypothetical protein